MFLKVRFKCKFEGGSLQSSLNISECLEMRAKRNVLVDHLRFTVHDSTWYIK